MPSKFLAISPTNPWRSCSRRRPSPCAGRKPTATSRPTEYVEWFWPFAEQIHRVLRPDGSFVMELGGAWNPGSGTRSLFPYELLLRLGKIFHLAQDFYWYNPSRLPTPAEWVTIRRTARQGSGQRRSGGCPKRPSRRRTIAACCSPTASR